MVTKDKIKEKIKTLFETKKLQAIKYLLKEEGTLRQYVRLKEDKEGKHYLEYAFCDGFPDNNYCLPPWADNLPIKKIYKINGWSGKYWYIDNTKNITSNDMFFRKKFRLSLNEIKKIIIHLIDFK